MPSRLGRQFSCSEKCAATGREPWMFRVPASHAGEPIFRCDITPRYAAATSTLGVLVIPNRARRWWCGSAGHGARVTAPGARRTAHGTGMHHSGTGHGVTFSRNPRVRETPSSGSDPGSDPTQVSARDQLRWGQTRGQTPGLTPNSGLVGADGGQGVDAGRAAHGNQARRHGDERDHGHHRAKDGRIGWLDTIQQ